MKTKLLLLFASLFLALTTGEIIIRNQIRYDADDNSWIFNRILQPYRFPINEVTKNLHEQIHDKTTIFIYDSILGWTLRPNFMGANSMGLRSDHREYSLLPSEDTLRIALFGDSYIYGSEVPFDSTVGALLEEQLLSQGVKAEVLNFGVGAYGMDQAYLRWKHFGKKFSPHIVVMGFQPENIFRNTNMVRALYSKKEAFPFMKPRFLIQGDSLALINVPVPLPDSLPGMLQYFDRTSIASHEKYYNKKYYEPRLLSQSRFFSYLSSFISENRFNIRSNEQKHFSLSGEPAQLALKIIEAFRQDAEKSGAKFLVVLLPRKEDVKTLMDGDDLPFGELLSSVEKTTTVLHPEKEFVKRAEQENSSILYRPAQHISGTGNKIIADILVKALR